ncbi:MAG: hypothetical protein K5931_02670, partial [Lachnospiraceae bacterium]|nr:hypothetical protein [Lachnospiraceae bacterium]
MVEGNNPEKIQEIKIDREWLQKVQDFYADISGLFLFAIDKQGRQITDISGRDIRETARIADLINKNQVEDLFRRVMYTRLEEQIIENTEYSNMKLAAVAVKVKSEAILCFMIAGVYKAQDGENAILNMRSVVDERVFFGGIDYVREIFDKVYSSEYRILSENKAEERALVEENEIRENLSKTESLNEIVQLLDSDESYEKICDKVVKIAA